MAIDSQTCGPERTRLLSAFFPHNQRNHLTVVIGEACAGHEDLSLKAAALDSCEVLDLNLERPSRSRGVLGWTCTRLCFSWSERGV
ncbi:hypothetical protein RRG08_044836 [Elysia crispata]|uniref:Uncharacterized protein n=1 Tax=Elysia crispata TaxID=231223 RepID=A0AAE0ZYD8_9GAST|nr:hypothetical protein RRG08_044836 [Elysia crispata]